MSIGFFREYVSIICSIFIVPGAKNRIIHSREASDLSDSYKADDYRKVMSELQDSRF